MIEEFIIEDNLSIKSNLTTLKEITENKIFYSIPIYQRLYVWGDDQVITLLEDLNRASKNMDKNYYLGGIMVTQNSDYFDLIDGQQRFTTLWLLSYELKEELENFAYSTDGFAKKKRLSFAIRDFANHYFENPELFSNLKEEEKTQLNNIVSAQATIKDFLKSKSQYERTQLAKYVYRKVALIKTEMPQNIDENRLFEVLNNRGVQLQHHEILKAKFIEQIPDEEKTQYAQLWDACAIMNEYVEKNIKEVCGFKWADLTFRGTETDQEVGLPADILGRISSNIESLEKLHLSDVLLIEDIKQQTSEDDFEYDSGKVRSIVSFPMFLLHSLRIFLHQKEGEESNNIVEVNEKKLLEIFQDSFFENYLNPSNTKQFIELIWQLRIKFDKYVIKWVEVEANEEHHIIKRLYLNKKTLQRRTPTSNEGFALLQSMLYHSQQIITHYWLTPFMFKMLTSDSFEELYLYLKKLDNKMFCSGSNQDLKTRSWNLINDNFLEFQPDITSLDAAQGTGYWSYWFYKLEFVLWNEFNDSKGVDWKNYRMTKKNSVEHISPQHPKDYDANKVWNDIDNDNDKRQKLDDFGNLVLLSVGMNSEYSNKTFSEKRTTFREKKRLDSLKSALIFENDHWNWDLCEQHRIEMITHCNKYFIDCSK